MKTYTIKNPDPAWPEIFGVMVFFFLFTGSNLLSSLPAPEFFMLNWWPLLRITLPFWIVARLIDFLQGGPTNRRMMRMAYREMKARLNESGRSF